MLDQAPTANHHHVRGVVVELTEDVRRHHDGHALRAQRQQQLGQVAARVGVQPRGRLVQQQHARFVNNGLGDRQPLAQAARQGAGLGIGPVDELHARNGLLHRRPHQFGRDALRHGRVAQALAHRQLIIESEKIRQVTDVAMAEAWLLQHRDAVQQDSPSERPLERRQAAQQGGLAGAVRPDQGRDRAGFNAEGHIVQRARAGVVKREVLDLNQRRHACPLPERCGHSTSASTNRLALRPVIAGRRLDSARLILNSGLSRFVRKMSRQFSLVVLHGLTLAGEIVG